jgi:CheY-like chemotaxis protein/MinD-like ATPase involved in chromosome partitioning or flagellar assembly
MTYKILTVDDHPQTLDIVIITLQQHGYLTVGTNSSVEAVSIAEKENPDLILLDMNMPEVNGLEVCRRLRSHPQLKEIPIIMFSAEAAEKLAGFEAGADDFLVKPTDPDEMISRIESLLESGTGAQSRGANGPSGVEAELVKSEAVAEGVGTGLASPEPPPKGRLIGIIGARGGAGATTLATNLALSSAQLGYATTLVDLDMAQGHVGLYLKMKMSGGLNALASLSDLQLAQKVPEALVHYRKNLRLLLAAPNMNGHYRTPAAEQIEIILGALEGLNRCVITDLGRELTAATRVALWEADEVIVCLRPERVALSSARRLLHHIREIVPAGTPIRPLIFGITGGMSLPKSSAEEYLGLQVAATIPARPQEMNRALNQGAAFVQLYPNSKVAKWFRWFARQLVLTGEAG